ncbi:MAG TPA: ABC transporter permease subunit [Stellaceae bacterium]|nr:ABC transporter permease subunit [Stellaceae bacterium]
MSAAALAARADAAPARRRAFSARAILFAIVLAVVAFLVLYPLGFLVSASLQVGPYGQATTFGFGNWVAGLTDPNLRSAIVNTLTLTATRQAIAFVAAIALAWLLARTNLPGRDWLEFGFWICFFLPTLPVLVGWIFLLDGHSGLINRLVVALGWAAEPPFEIYSWWGIVFVHLMTNTVAVQVMLFTPAFRNLDSSLLEMAHVAGAGTLAMLLRVILPVLAPTILVVVLLGTIRSLEAFEIELILGPPAKIAVFSTAIYQHVFDSPPTYGAAFALSIAGIALMVPFVAAQQAIARRRARATVAGKFTLRTADLGPWRWPLYTLVLLLLAAMTVLPIAFMLLGSFMEVFGYFDVPGGAFTLAHWTTVLQDRLFLGSLWDTVVVATGTAVVSMLLFPPIAYLIVRTRYVGRGVLDFLTWLPTTVPGIVIGLALLWVFLKTPGLRQVYGHELGLVLAFVLAGMALGVQIIKAAILQLSPELEEAAQAAGASWLATMRTIVVPMIAPAAAVVGILEFVAATRGISTTVLLSSHATQTLAVFQLKFIEAGDLETASVVGIVVLALSTGVALAGRVLGLRFGLGER